MLFFGVSAQAQGRTQPDLTALIDSDTLIELGHLDHLSQLFDVEGKQLRGVWIYAEPGASEADAYQFREAPGEGVTCVDDVARAALVYLAAHRQGLGDHSLEYARQQLDFVLEFQDPDGEFYNFVFADGAINRLGVTSRKSAGFWAARALWAIGEGMALFRDVDPGYYQTLREAFLLGVQPFARNVDAKWGQYHQVGGFTAPAWFPGDGADVAAILLLGLSSFLSVDEDATAQQLATRLADGLVEFQYGPAGTYPFLAHPSFARDPLQWHAWGSRQSQALARASSSLGGDDWRASAEAEAGHFFVHLLASEGPIELMTPAVKVGPQIAFGMESIASGYFELYKATGKEVYAELGGLMTGWLTGNNELREEMYDPITGRTFDGLERGVINRNAGAESTITALMALLQARDAARLSELTWEWLWKQSDLLLELETGLDFGEAPKVEVDTAASGQMTAVLEPGAAVTVSVDVPLAAAYRVLALFRDDPWEATARVAIGREVVGSVSSGRSGSGDGVSGAPYHLVDLGELDLRAGTARFIVSHEAGREMRFDALVLRPVLTQKLYGRKGERRLLVKSWAPEGLALDGAELAERALAAIGATEVANLTVRVYDSTANLQAATGKLPPYGFAFIDFGSSESLPDLFVGRSEPSELVEVGFVFSQGGYHGLDLGALFNNDAFSDPRNPTKGNFDARSGALGATYPAEHAPTASAVTELIAVPLFFPPSDQDANNVAFKAQKIIVPTGHYGTLWLLGASEQGNYEQPLTLEYSDGTTDSVQLGLSDWCQLPRFGEAVALEFAQRRGASGAVERLTCRIYLQRLAVDANKELTAIALPDRETMHVFSLTLEEPTVEPVDKTPEEP